MMPFCELGYERLLLGVVADKSATGTGAPKSFGARQPHSGAERTRIAMTGIVSSSWFDLGTLNALTSLIAPPLLRWHRR